MTAAFDDPGPRADHGSPEPPPHGAPFAPRTVGAADPARSVPSPAGASDGADGATPEGGPAPGGTPAAEGAPDPGGTPGPSTSPGVGTGSGARTGPGAPGTARVPEGAPLLPPGARVFVAGHRGLAGSAIARHLAAEGYQVLTRDRAALDLRDADRTAAMLRAERPDAVVLAAARVGGILANQRYPVPFLEDNLRIQLSVIAGAHAADVDRLLLLGSSCIYPRHAEQPIREEALLTGPLEPTNEPYALAKIAGISQVQSYRAQFGRRYIAAMPTNLYGPGDTFDPETAHVLPALIRRFDEAARADRPDVTLWGSGTPRREFLHTDDLARACLLLLRHYDDPLPINVGCGRDLTIAELAALIASVTGFRGRVHWDTSRPDGTPRKLLDTRRLAALGFAPAIGLEHGVRDTWRWWRSEEAEEGAPFPEHGPGHRTAGP